MPELPQDAIPLSTAVTWVDNWRNADSHNLVDAHGNVIKGFWIPSADLSETLAESGAESARSYIGIDENNEFHLLIVGVDGDGNDMTDEEAGQFVYDLTRPCPPMCSQSGPLK
jgi:hypothetical protein